MSLYTKSVDWSIYPPANGTVLFFILTTSNFSCIFYVFNFDFLNSLILSYLWWRTCPCLSQVPLLPASCGAVHFCLSIFCWECSSVRLFQWIPRYVLLLSLKYQPVIKWEGSGMSLQPFSRAAEIYSCPSLLFSSKRQTVSLFIGGKNISSTVMVGETWKSAGWGYSWKHSRGQHFVNHLFLSFWLYLLSYGCFSSILTLSSVILAESKNWWSLA